MVVRGAQVGRSHRAVIDDDAVSPGPSAAHPHHPSGVRRVYRRATSGSQIHAVVQFAHMGDRMHPIPERRGHRTGHRPQQCRGPAHPRGRGKTRRIEHLGRSWVRIGLAARWQEPNRYLPDQGQWVLVAPILLQPPVQARRLAVGVGQHMSDHLAGMYDVSHLDRRLHRHVREASPVGHEDDDDTVGRHLTGDHDDTGHRRAYWCTHRGL